MNNRKCRELRKVLGLPRLPKAMNPQERRHYRQTKVRYVGLPHTAKATFLDDVTALKQIWAKAMERQGAVNQLSPS